MPPIQTLFLETRLQYLLLSVLLVILGASVGVLWFIRLGQIYPLPHRFGAAAYQHECVEWLF